MNKIIITFCAVGLYRILENLDGERFIKIIPYKQAQQGKMFLLKFIN